MTYRWWDVRCIASVVSVFPRGSGRAGLLWRAASTRNDCQCLNACGLSYERWRRGERERRLGLLLRRRGLRERRLGDLERLRRRSEPLSRLSRLFESRSLSFSRSASLLPLLSSTTAFCTATACATDVGTGLAVFGFESELSSASSSASTSMPDILQRVSEAPQTYMCDRPARSKEGEREPPRRTAEARFFASPPPAHGSQAPLHPHHPEPARSSSEARFEQCHLSPCLMRSEQSWRSSWSSCHPARCPTAAVSAGSAGSVRHIVQCIVRPTYDLIEHRTCPQQHRRAFKWRFVVGRSLAMSSAANPDPPSDHNSGYGFDGFKGRPIHGHQR